MEKNQASLLGPIALVLVIIAVGLPGCTEELAPRDHFELPFSLYGVLSPDLDTQSVRLYVLEDFPSLGTSEPPDVVFTTTDLITGDIQTWRDTVLVEGNGQHEYIYWAPFRAEYGHRYRVEVKRRTDGARSFAEVRVPPPATVRLLDADSTTFQVRIEGEDIRALKPEIEYMVQADADMGLGPLLSYRISYQTREKQVEQGWQIEVRLILDRYWVQRWYTADIGGGGIDCPILLLRDMEFHVLVGDSVWNPPGGVFDPNVLSHPTTMTNVENGFGFVGGGYRIVESLRPGRKAVEEACFIYDW